jgi:DNA-binding response OmpR family regulator
VLAREKFQIDCARDGMEAIEKLRQNEYSTVLLDMMMPRVDGLGVIRFLEQHSPETTRRVIVMTANTQCATHAAAPRDIPVIPKPFDIRQLVGHVRETIARSSAAGDTGSAGSAT